MLIQLLKTRAKRAITDSLTFSLPKVKVKVNQGVVCGCVEKLPDGKSFQRFLGIPFAKPPINALRFRSPQKLLQFDEDEIDCTTERDASFHKNSIWKKYVGSENCLNLNVYVPSEASSTNKLEVMVFIHGGGLVFDSNSRDFYSPEYLLMENVIVVTINYRLHALGFLSLPSMGISGNAGLKDQQMALEWVHENISNFNGDPNKICLFGESAGAACTHLHVLNEKSRRFIRSAICQSNYAHADWFFQKDGVNKTRRLAQILGATGNSDEEYLNTLMKATPQQIYDKNIRVVDPESDDFRRNLPFAFKPVLEEESDDSFITMNPTELIKSQKGKVRIPMIFGLNNGDGMTMASYYRSNKLHLFDNDYVRLVPMSLNIDPQSDEAKLLAREIKEFYFGDKPIDNKSISKFVDFMTDFHFTIPQTITNELHARYLPESKQFVYEFCYAGELNAFKRLLKMDDVKGACHFDELFYLFDSKLIGMEIAKDSPAWKMRQTMCKMWTNFAKHGNPTPDHDDQLTVKWNPVQPLNDNDNSKSLDVDYLKIDDTLAMHKNIYKDRIDFWRKVYEKYNKSFLNPKF